MYEQLGLCKRGTDETHRRVVEGEHFQNILLTNESTSRPVGRCLNHSQIEINSAIYIPPPSFNMSPPQAAVVHFVEEAKRNTNIAPAHEIEYTALTPCHLSSRCWKQVAMQKDVVAECSNNRLQTENCEDYPSCQGRQCDDI